MKAIFVIAFVFACMFCEVTSLKCYQCASESAKSESNDNYFKSLPNCASQELVQCGDSQDFCFKAEYDWFRSLIDAEPAGHYFAKACTGPSENACTKSGYYWYLFHWFTCCQGDGCNK